MTLIDQWTQSEYDNLVEKLNKIKKDGSEAFSELSKATTEDVGKCYKRKARDGVIARLFRAAAADFRNEKLG